MQRNIMKSYAKLKKSLLENKWSETLDLPMIKIMLYQPIRIDTDFINDISSHITWSDDFINTITSFIRSFQFDKFNYETFLYLPLIQASFIKALFLTLYQTKAPEFFPYRNSPKQNITTGKLKKTNFGKDEIFEFTKFFFKTLINDLEKTKSSVPQSKRSEWEKIISNLKSEKIFCVTEKDVNESINQKSAIKYLMKKIKYLDRIERIIPKMQDEKKYKREFTKGEIVREINWSCFLTPKNFDEFQPLTELNQITDILKFDCDFIKPYEEALPSWGLDLTDLRRKDPFLVKYYFDQEPAVLYKILCYLDERPKFEFMDTKDFDKWYEKVRRELIYQFSKKSTLEKEKYLINKRVTSSSVPIDFCSFNIEQFLDDTQVIQKMYKQVVFYTVAQ